MLRLSTAQRLSLFAPLLCLAAGEGPSTALDHGDPPAAEPAAEPASVPGTQAERDGNDRGTPTPIRDRAKQRTRRRATSRRRKTRGY